MQRLSYKLILLLVALTGALELALSGIHIRAITIMFTRHIGFYLFLFILFGVLLIAISSSIKVMDLSNAFKLIFSSGVASFSGAYTAYLMWNNFKTSTSISINNFRTSFYLIIAGVIIYAVGTLILLGIGLLDKREEKH